MTPSKRRLGKRIRRLRQDLKLTQPELAELMGVVPSSVSEWESGHTSPTFDRLIRLADVLKVEVSALVEAA